MIPRAPGRDQRERPIYPSERSFLVKFSRDSTLADEQCSGHIEHLDSGRAIRFGNLQQLFAFIGELFASAAGD